MKILIVNNNLEIGGIQKALVNLLAEISKEHSVTLMVFNKDGALADCIGKDVKIKTANFFTRIMGLTQQQAKEKGFLTFLWRSLWVILTRVFGTKFSFNALSSMQKLPEEYDVAISYMQNSAYKMFYGGCNEFVIKAVKAKKKISFIHCDFANYEGNNPYNASLYEKFDKIACVSDSCRERFLSVCPNLEDKAVTVYNVHDFKGMRALAVEFVPEAHSEPVMFTSARITEEKGYLRMMPILGRIKQKGGEFIWYIAGDGPLKERAENLAKQNGIENNVKFLGMLKNPYPYFKAADMLLIPSFNEAAPMVYHEALCFSTPIFTTDTSSAKELCGGYGWIVENDDEKIEEALSDIILNKRLIKIDALEMSNEKALKDFSSLIEN